MASSDRQHVDFEEDMIVLTSHFVLPSFLQIVDSEGLTRQASVGTQPSHFMAKM